MIMHGRRATPIVRMAGRGLGQSGGCTGGIANLTTGDNSTFTVGNAYRLFVGGCGPFLSVYLNTQKDQWPKPMTGQQDLALSAWMGSYQTGNDPVGTTDSSGNWQMSGTITQAMVGRWVIYMNVSGQSLIGAFFSVADASGTVTQQPAPAEQGTPYYQLASNQPPVAAPQAFRGPGGAPQIAAGVPVYVPPPVGSGQPAPPAAVLATIKQLAPTPLPPAPPPKTIVNPSPPSQPTSTPAPGSVTSQANGTIAAPTLLSTVQGYLSDIESGTDIIPGVSNWVLLAGAGALVVGLVMAAEKR